MESLPDHTIKTKAVCKTLIERLGAWGHCLTFDESQLLLLFEKES